MKYLLLILLILGALTLVEITHARSLTISNSCIAKVCDKLGTFACRDDSELRQITEVCETRGIGLECFDAITSRVNPFDADEWPELKSYLLACRFNRSSACLDTFAHYLGVFDLDEPSEYIHAATSCQRVQSDCVSATCERLGVFACESFSQLDQVASSCRRNP